MAFTIPDDSPGISAAVEWVDAHGHAAQVDGATTWSSSDDTILTVTVNPTDSTKATVMPAGHGSLGNAQIVAAADAVIGSGVQEIMATGDITVVGGQAVGGTITFESPPTP